MSKEAVQWALKVREPDLDAKAVLLLLAEYATAEGLAWPAVAMIALRCEITQPEVRGAISRLQQRQLIAVEKQGGVNAYRLTLTGGQ